MFRVFGPKSTDFLKRYVVKNAKYCDMNKTERFSSLNLNRSFRNVLRSRKSKGDSLFENPVIEEPNDREIERIVRDIITDVVEKVHKNLAKDLETTQQQPLKRSNSFGSVSKSQTSYEGKQKKMKPDELIPSQKSLSSSNISDRNVCFDLVSTISSDVIVTEPIEVADLQSDQMPLVVKQPNDCSTIGADLQNRPNLVSVVLSDSNSQSRTKSLVNLMSSLTATSSNERSLKSFTIPKISEKNQEQKINIVCETLSEQVNPVENFLGTQQEEKPSKCDQIDIIKLDKSAEDEDFEVLDESLPDAPSKTCNSLETVEDSHENKENGDYEVATTNVFIEPYYVVGSNFGDKVLDEDSDDSVIFIEENSGSHQKLLCVNKENDESEESCYNIKEDYDSDDCCILEDGQNGEDAAKEELDDPEGFLIIDEA